MGLPSSLIWGRRSRRRTKLQKIIVLRFGNVLIIALISRTEYGYHHVRNAHTDAPPGRQREPLPSVSFRKDAHNIKKNCAYRRDDGEKKKGTS